jgi:hypothetical protein
LILGLTAMLAAATEPVAPSSPDQDLAALFNADVDQIHSTPAVWNGTSLVFVDFPVES